MNTLDRADVLLLHKSLWHTDMTLDEGLELIGIEASHLSQDQLEDVIDSLREEGLRFSEAQNCWVSI